MIKFFRAVLFVNTVVEIYFLVSFAQIKVDFLYFSRYFLMHICGPQILKYMFNENVAIVVAIQV